MDNYTQIAPYTTLTQLKLSTAAHITAQLSLLDHMI